MRYRRIHYKVDEEAQVIDVVSYGVVARTIFFFFKWWAWAMVLGLILALAIFAGRAVLGLILALAIFAGRAVLGLILALAIFAGRAWVLLVTVLPLVYLAGMVLFIRWLRRAHPKHG